MLSVEEKKVVSKNCDFCNKNVHYVKDCKDFLKLDVDGRWKWAKEGRRCFICLKTGHITSYCENKKGCGINKCYGPHHSLLHHDKPRKPVSESETKIEEKTESLCNAVHSILLNTNEILLGVLPVVLSGPAGEVKTFALADDGSTVTIIEESLADELGLTGPTEIMKLKGVNPNSMTFPESRRTNVKISGAESEEQFQLKARTVRNIELPKQSVHIQSLCERFPYLKNVKLSSQENVVPRMLIGSDNIHLIISRELIEGKENEPILSKTKLGWIVKGNTVKDKRLARKEYKYFNIHEQKDEELHQLVKESFKTETFGVAVPKTKLKSNDEKRADEILEKTTTRVGERWQTGLLWKCDDVHFPNSNFMALNRLKTVERKMDRDESYGKLYCNKIQEYLSKGYARKLSKEEIETKSKKLFYLPHFGVVNPHKPGKLRIVFDAAAKAQGVSLNDMLLTGPDLYNSLVGILLRFRRGRIAFIGDICEMFPQIKIIEEDLPAQRFLFRGMERKEEPDVYEMSVMLFGAACSPASAQYVKNRNAVEMKEEFPAATETILRNFYMDDYLDSVDEEEEATQRIKDVIEIHRRGGFDITSWICNSETVLESIPVEKRAGAKKNLNIESTLNIDRVLGLYWNSNTDCFTFTTNFPKVDVNIINGTKVPTKREVLRLIMSVFDPLGIIANFTVKVKILLQEVWKCGIDWDDLLPDEINKKWIIWINQLSKVSSVQVPRLYSILRPNADSIQLHVFVDASMQAFCAVSYLRIQNGNEISTAFVMARTRVAPLKPMTVPRLELQAAVMGTRLAETIKQEIDMKIDEVIFWSDSSNVIRWIRSDARKYKQFVAFRIGEILETTEVANWRWIPTAENVADEGTRYDSRVSFENSSRWLNGPEFLLKSPEEWPKEKTEEAVDDEELEMKKDFVAVTKEIQNDYLPAVSIFSTFTRLLHTTARLFKCARIWKSRNKNDEITLVSDLERAGFLLIRRAQLESFAEEIKLLETNKIVPKSSKLYQLSPKLDENGLLRLSGRIRRASGVTDDVKNPIILDSKNEFTKLILEDFHIKAGHAGVEFVLNEVRQKYYIPKARSAVRKIWRNCLLCKIKKAKPNPPMMGELPSCRLQSQVRPFTHTGMDYFGLITVTIGRRHEKRYGVLFTCMTTRAIHLEIAASLTTDSAIQAIRRMIARRGYPAKIYSDNGTNLKGADTEMKKALKELNQEAITTEMALKKIEWFFMPPAAPHMSGSWERLIRSVKMSLNAVLKEQHPKEETLHTFLVEAENIVNSRPLTHVSMDPDDKESLTPNHFLIGSSSASQPAGLFSEDDLCLRKQWRIAQHYADLFWKRWLREYLPTLTKRTKWYENSESIKISDVVIIADDNLARNCWPKGIVVATFPGKDGKVRVADVKTSTGIFRRPVTKLCVLDIKKSDNEPVSVIRGKNVVTRNEEDDVCLENADIQEKEEGEN